MNHTRVTIALMRARLALSAARLACYRAQPLPPSALVNP